MLFPGDAPIINSLLDSDFYQFSMGQLVFHRHSDVQVGYVLINRKPKIRLADVISEQDLRRELDHVLTLQANNSELHYLRGTNEYGERMFREDYLEFFSGIRLPPYSLKVSDGQFDLRFEGPWANGIYWETIALPIINELYYRALLKKMSRFERDCVFAEGQRRLMEKIKLLKGRPSIRFADFGTRRRFSREWQEYVNIALAAELPIQLRGTSNVAIAMRLGLLPMGTSAHQLFMVMASLADKEHKDIIMSQREVLDEWWQEYGLGLSIALPDTYGTQAFLRDVMSPEHARNWKGFRGDSGSLIEEGQRIIAFYQSLGIDSREKLYVPSDGLDIKTIFEIENSMLLRGKIQLSHGWGTNLTNDLGLEPLSIVVKPYHANGHPTVKLSNNLAKASGPPEVVGRYKTIFGYTGTYEQACTY